MSNFRPIDRDTGFLLPPSVDEWLPERHLARFVVEVIGGLDLRSMSAAAAKVTDQGLLAKLANQAIDWQIRQSAVWKLTDQVALANVAIASDDAG